MLHLRSQARFTRPEFNFLESKYERSGFSQTLPYVGAGGPVVLASVLCAYAHAHGQACRTRVNMHVCVCNARRLLLPVSSPTFYVPCRTPRRPISRSRGSLTDDKRHLDSPRTRRDEAIIIVELYACAWCARCSLQTNERALLGNSSVIRFYQRGHV